MPELSAHVAIEYGNRLLSAVVGFACVAAAVLVFRRRPFRRDLVGPAVVLGAGVIAQGLLGGATVLLDLSWPVVIAHYLLSMVLLLAGAVLVWRARRPAAPPPAGDRAVVLATRALVAFGGMVIVAGTFATAAGPHAGGAGTGDYVERLEVFGVSTLETLIDVHGHSAAALGIATVLLWLVAFRRGVRGALLRVLGAICVLMGVQGVVGLVQYYNALPAEVVWVHASLPAVMWVAFVWSWAAAGRPVAAAATQPAAAATA